MASVLYGLKHGGDTDIDCIRSRNAEKAFRRKKGGRSRVEDIKRRT
jgi:hypothetical protein